MGANSKISWTDHTFNPWIGCTKVGPGCENCYAESLDARYRFGGKQQTHWGPGVPRQRTGVANWRKPLSWHRAAVASGVRAKVFCASLADVFDNEVPDEWRTDLWTLIALCHELDWILVTKRVGNVSKMTPASWMHDEWPANVWLLATMVNQEEVDRDISKLARIPAPVTGLSIEPMLERISAPCGVNWIICGAESGSQHRPFDEDWARSLRDHCQLYGIAFFYKQNIVDGKKTETPELDGRRWIEFPACHG